MTTASSRKMDAGCGMQGRGMQGQQWCRRNMGRRKLGRGTKRLSWKKRRRSMADKDSAFSKRENGSAIYWDGKEWVLGVWA